MLHMSLSAKEILGALLRSRFRRLETSAFTTRAHVFADDCTRGVVTSLRGLAPLGIGPTNSDLPYKRASLRIFPAFDLLISVR